MDDRPADITVKGKVSVLMGAYNCCPTLAEAIDSILSQTYSDYELIICDDGSADGTFELASEYARKYPDKIVLLQNEKNKGLNATLNRCFSVAKGEYTARMDGDDISLPERLEHEVAALEKHPDMAIVSCSMIRFDENGDWGVDPVKEYPAPRDLVNRAPFCHAPCMIRSAALYAVDGYSVSSKTLRTEDWDLWIRMYEKGFRGMNLSEALYKMRDDRNAYTRRKFRHRLNEAGTSLSAVKKLRLPIWLSVYSLKPIIVGLLPEKLYMLLHRRNLSAPAGGNTAEKRT